MAQNFKAPGDVVELTNGSGATIVSGGLMIFGGRCVVAVNEVINGAVGSFYTKGVFEFDLASAAGAITQALSIYMTDSIEGGIVVTDVVTTATRVGKATSTAAGTGAADGDEKILVLLDAIDTV